MYITEPLTASIIYFFVTFPNCVPFLPATEKPITSLRQPSYCKRYVLFESHMMKGWSWLILFFQVAKEATAQSLSPARIKKIYVLSALLVGVLHVYKSLWSNCVLNTLKVEQHRSHSKHQQMKAKAEMGSSGDKKGEVGGHIQCTVIIFMSCYWTGMQWL